MENKEKSTLKRVTLRMVAIAIIILLLLIPLAMVKEIISEREDIKELVIEEVAESFAGEQYVEAPILSSSVVVKSATDSTEAIITSYDTKCETLKYNVTVDTDMLHRSIYDVVVYNSKIDIKGSIKLNEVHIKACSNTISLEISDFRGLSTLPEFYFGEKKYKMSKDFNCLQANVDIPHNAKVGDTVNFNLTLNLKGTKSLMFEPNAEESVLSISSSYPHPSFQGTILPDNRDVRKDGFNAEWKVLDINLNFSKETMGVEFVEPAGPYQQSMRTAKYGILIILLVFVAGLYVEFLTKKEISLIQYIVIGLSLVLFYSLLLAFSEFISFGLSYLIAALMTIISLLFYFKAILKSSSAYMLGGFVSLVYVANYMLLRMETLALLTGSLLLFVLLSVVMFLTANMNKKRDN